jgi:hypothetical protein
MSSINKDRAFDDKTRLIFGTGKDADIHYDGSDLRIKPDSVGSGNVLMSKRPKYLRYEFDRAPRPIIAKSNGLGASTGTAGDENLYMWPGLILEQHILGTQTILFCGMTTTGLDIGSMDQTANDGMELCPGISSDHDQRFVVGTDAAFYAEAKIKVADVSGTDDLAFGFRKVEAYQANIDDYDEMAVLNVISGDINIETILNGGTTTTTDTTDNLADAGTVSLKVLVSAAGVVTYQIDGAAPTATAAFTFDDGEVVVPFLYFLQDTDIAGTVELIHWECGHQKP